ncbi:MAG: hypothetical protein WCV90_07820 [Candidatus Woesearchaeota archaeon]|jgi:hypothetical protein
MLLDEIIPAIERNKVTQFKIEVNPRAGVSDSYIVYTDQGNFFVKRMQDNDHNQNRARKMKQAGQFLRNVVLIDEEQRAGGNIYLLTKQCQGTPLDQVTDKAEAIRDKVIPLLASNQKSKLAEAEHRSGFLGPDFGTTFLINLYSTFNLNAQFFREVVEASAYSTPPYEVNCPTEPRNVDGTPLHSLALTAIGAYHSLIETKLVEAFQRYSSDEGHLYRALSVNDLKAANVIIGEEAFICDTKKFGVNTIFADLARLLYDRRLNLTEAEREGLLDHYSAHFVEQVAPSPASGVQALDVDKNLESLEIELTRKWGSPKWADTWRGEIGYLTEIEHINQELTFIDEYAINYLAGKDEAKKGLEVHLEQLRRSCAKLSMDELYSATEALFKVRNLDHLKASQPPSFPALDANRTFYWITL